MALIARQLDPSRYSPVLAAPAGSSLFAAWRAAGWDVEGTPPVHRLRDPLGTIRVVRAFADIVRKRDIGIVHTNGVGTHVHAGLAARRTGRLVISHVRDIFDATWSRNGVLHRLSLAVPRDATIAASLGVAASLRARGCIADVIADPVQTDVVAPIERHRPLVVWCGRLQRWKGCHLFLEAARRVLETRPETRFAVVGGTLFGLEPDYANELRVLADTFGLGRAVEFAGHVPDARPWLRAADLLVHCTVRPEPFGMVMAEAMIQERPVVAFRHGAAEENVIDGLTGRLVAPGDTTALAGAIDAVLGDAAARQAMGVAGRSRALKLYAVDVVTRQVEGVYDRVTARAHLVHHG
jgi:glycosyltransferase involved in cell wall biosynthesis